MARKNKDNNYFEMIANMAGFSCTAAVKLKDYIENYSPLTAESGRKEIHEIEHKGDDLRHEIMHKLVREFITPIEREDIYQLVQIIDDITDAIDDVPIKMYMLNVRSIAPRAVEFCELIVRITAVLKETTAEFHNYKKTDRLLPLIIEINNIESEADALYMQSIREIYTNDKLDAIEKTVWKEIYECFETCCDLCEHAADAIENAIMKNS